MNDTFNNLDHFQLPHSPEYDQKTATKAKMSNSTVPRERRPSTGAPIDLQGPVGPGFTRPKHKRTFTGFGAGEIKSVEGKSIYACYTSMFIYQASFQSIRLEINSNVYRTIQLRFPNLNAQPGRSTKHRALRPRMNSRRRSFAMSRPLLLDPCSIAMRPLLTLLPV